VTVGVSGAVGNIKMLRETPPFTDALSQSLRAWTFRAAEQETTSATGERERKPVVSKVLVAGMFRAPSIMGPTLGEVPKDVATASAEIPFPLTAEVPPYPPAALTAGIVLVEVRVGADGKVADAKVVRSDAAFDQAALDTARKWTFRPAKIAGVATSMPAYLVFSFRPPITD
jgi:TonB family protein